MLITAIVLYTLVTLVFLGETYFEGVRERAGWDLWRLVGIGLCLVWPLHMLIVLPAAIWPQLFPAHANTAGRD